MREIYGVPDSEMGLLPFGADMDLIEETQARCDRDALRAELGTGPEDFVIFTGGKIKPHKHPADIKAANDTHETTRSQVRIAGGVPDTETEYHTPLPLHPGHRRSAGSENR